MAAAQIAGLNCLKLMNETTAGKWPGHFLSFEAVQAVECEGDDTLLLHNWEPGRELSRLVLPNPVWELETQHWGGEQHLGGTLRAGVCQPEHSHTWE